MMVIPCSETTTCLMCIPSKATVNAFSNTELNFADLLKSPIQWQSSTRFQAHQSEGLPAIYLLEHLYMHTYVCMCCQ